MTDSHLPASDDALPYQQVRKRQPWWREFAALWAFGLREYRIWQSYRVNQVLWMTNILVTTLLFFLLWADNCWSGRAPAGSSVWNELYVLCRDRCDRQCLHQYQSE